MTLGSAACQGLKPVREMRCAIGKRPVLHASRNSVGNRRIKRLALAHGRKQLRRNGLGHMGTDGLLGENILAVAFNKMVVHCR